MKRRSGLPLKKMWLERNQSSQAVNILPCQPPGHIQQASCHPPFVWPGPAAMHTSKDAFLCRPVPAAGIRTCQSRLPPLAWSWGFFPFRQGQRAAIRSPESKARTIPVLRAARSAAARCVGRVWVHPLLHDVESSSTKHARRSNPWFRWFKREQPRKSRPGTCGRFATEKRAKLSVNSGSCVRTHLLNHRVSPHRVLVRALVFQCGGVGCGAVPGFTNKACCINGVLNNQADCAVSGAAPCVVGLGA